MLNVKSVDDVNDDMNEREVCFYEKGVGGNDSGHAYIMNIIIMIVHSYEVKRDLRRKCCSRIFFILICILSASHLQLRCCQWE